MAIGPTPAALAPLRLPLSVPEDALQQVIGSALYAAAQATHSIASLFTAPVAPPLAMSGRTSPTMPLPAQLKRAGQLVPVWRSRLHAIGARKRNTFSSTLPTGRAPQIAPSPMQAERRLFPT